MIESVDFWPKYKIEQYVLNKDSIVISIKDNDMPEINILSSKLIGEHNILRLSFLDIEEPIDSPKFNPDFLFDFEKANKISNFIHYYHNKPEKKQLIVHCSAGISRSAAVALYAEFITNCHFENKDKANFANKLIIHHFNQITGTSIKIPPTKSLTNNIIIF